MAITPWLHYADPTLAPICRSVTRRGCERNSRGIGSNRLALFAISAALASAAATTGPRAAGQ